MDDGELLKHHEARDRTGSVDNFAWSFLSLDFVAGSGLCATQSAVPFSLIHIAHLSGSPRKNAAPESQRILDHPGLNGNSPLGA